MNLGLWESKYIVYLLFSEAITCPKFQKWQAKI